ncbi:MAG: hypothetical protein LBE07_05135 [Gordonia sp. (in: high G+C Gram-positive bacteria)]|jgi:hypothetical protein|nr:hypothetical protein [Gordonia sp. (in: high G+C Gram-positive bacteria)]
MRSRKKISPTDIPLIVLDDETTEYARSLADQGTPMAVVSVQYSPVLPFMVGNKGYTVAMVADVDDPIQLADVLGRVESRIGAVTRTVRGHHPFSAA